MTEATIYEHHFITNDGPIFNMIEDDSGDVFWGYGHREPDEFTGEINRWLIHVNAATVPDDLIPLGAKVDHLWAKYKDGNDEYFELVESSEPHAFPVTRFWL